jgi:plasmid stabilization system protein ParE
LDVIEKEAQTLAFQPLMGRARPELRKEVRCWPTSAAYNLYDVASDSGITVIRVCQVFELARKILMDEKDVHGVFSGLESSHVHMGVRAV